MKQLLLAVAAVIAGLAMSISDAEALTCSSPIGCTNGSVTAPTVLTGTPVQYGVALSGAAQAVTFLTPSASTTNYLKSGGSSANPTWSAIATGDLPTTVLIEADVGAGLSVTAGTINTQSDEVSFLVDGGAGALTCGAAAGGKMQINDTANLLQFCDGQSTSVLSYAAIGDSSGYANNAKALRSATTSVDVSAATAPSNGQCLKATSSTTATWGSCTTGSATDQTYIVSETKILQGSTTAYMSLSGMVSTTEAEAAVPTVGTYASTYGRLHCRASGTTGGSGIAITLGLAPNASGACGTFSYATKPTTTVTSTTGQSDNSNVATIGTSENECLVFKLVPTSTTADVFVQCSIERS